MPRINGNQVTPGTVIDHDGGLCVAVKTNAVKPGKGGAFNQMEIASSYKPAVLENGLRVLVPPFIGSGERIVVHTSEVTHMRRAD
jgi:Elongation factor P, C-terminal/Elongation factor P (EF-P) KOW-like domain